MRTSWKLNKVLKIKTVRILVCELFFIFIIKQFTQNTNYTIINTLSNR